MSATGANPAQPSLDQTGHARLVALLDEAPLRLPHILAWALASGGTLLDGISVFMLGIAMPILTHDLALTPLQTGLLGAALVAGAIVGAATGGRLADRVGRKRVFLLDMLLMAVAAAA
ncbi:MAG: MFS transporter, partial [Actinomycetota bacterium]|nr:MFS transporter [Actinomycetota bacterium]